MIEENSFIGLAKKQVLLFEKDHISWMNLLVTSVCVRKIMFMAYNSLVNHKNIRPIQDMSEKEKSTIWESAKEFAKDRLKKDELVQVSKALISLEYLLQ